MIRVLIADDSAFMRKVLADMFASQPDFEVAGTARNGQETVEKVRELSPDLVTLDVNMPVMDGLEALDIIMKEHPLPVVMLSSLTQKGTEQTVKALALGAVDFISKAGGSISRIDGITGEILEKCRAAAKAHARKNPSVPARSSAPPGPPVMKRIQLPLRQGHKPPDRGAVKPPEPATPANTYAKRNNPLLKRNANPPVPPSKPSAVPMTSMGRGAEKLVVIGTSTGGPQALQNVITRLPGNLPCGVVVVQHMPAGFTKALADRLNAISDIAVKEAEDGEGIKPGMVYIAPGNYHLRIKNGTQIVLGQDPPVGNHRPAVNVMFSSVASLGRKLVAVIMTGMGCDGCDGMREIKKAGGYSIAQDEPTCVVYGMPKAVVDAGLADEIKPVQNIAQAIVEAVKR
ncbi:MAG: chemotaxis response regulator protein-glutamate methylesterase [Selenomonas sp.]|nr:chemotaxis response regulator protein-glutamate methylesterase [Selenomonas sp.]